MHTDQEDEEIDLGDAPLKKTLKSLLPSALILSICGSIPKWSVHGPEGIASKGRSSNRPSP
jgi:hypothetical protein